MGIFKQTMGQTHPSHTGDTGATQNIDTTSRTSNILSEKEYMFIAIRNDIDQSIGKKDYGTMETLEAEIRKHMVELSTLKKHYVHMPRLDKLLYNYELCLAKVRSFLAHDNQERDDVTDEEFQQMVQEFADVNKPVSSQIDDNKDEGRPQSNNEEYFDSTSQITNHSATSDEPRNENSQSNRDSTLSSQGESYTTPLFQDSIALRKQQLRILEQQDGVLTDEDIQQALINLTPEKVGTDQTGSNKGCQEQSRLYPSIPSRNSEVRLSSEELYNEQRINELEIMYDSCCTEKDYKELEDKVFAFVNLIHTSTSKNRSIWVKQTVELLEKIKATRRALYINESKSNITTEAEAIDYLTLWESQSATLPEQTTSHDLDNNGNSSIYSNFESIRKHLNGSLNSNEEQITDERDRPETIYSNVEVIREHKNTLDQRAQNNSKISENPVHKPPVPNPRRHEDKLMKDLAVYWEQICDIEEKSTVTLEDIRQVEDMQKYLEVAQEIFKRKIESVKKKYDEIHRETVDV